ncbi:hypothetical protein J3R82DRAFT_8992 [Butyriboletus roseoflavus]|nr:hypothetical protein J3R82DRAFT_8992 [Butyriboletus roseoflavus]
MLGHTGRPCQNTKIQCLASKPIEVKCGTYGLGAFACQNMNKGAFLGSYVGHIINNQLAEPMTELAKHTKLNYVFEVTPDKMDVQLPVFDAAHLGNATRFLNHMPDRKANVEAKCMSSNILHSRMTHIHVESYAGYWGAPNWISHKCRNNFLEKKVKAGEELFLNYGDNYWRDSKE